MNTTSTTMWQNPEPETLIAEINRHTLRKKFSNPFDELEKSMYAALETYSNVHRGSGHYSMVTTHLYEKAREIVLEYLGLHKSEYMVVFCSVRRAAAFLINLKPGSFQILRSREFGLNLGVVVIAVRKKELPATIPTEAGGGTTKLYGQDWVMWAKAPDRFEAGTPAIINILAFAKALMMIKEHGNLIFMLEPGLTGQAQQILHEDEFTAYSGSELLNRLREKVIGRSVLVPTANGLKPFINFDNSASTQTFEPVWKAFAQAYRLPENDRKEIVNEVKQICADTLGAPLKDYDVFFTSNTTECINLMAQSLGNKKEEDIEPVILTTILEHSSNDLPWRTVAGHGVIRFAVDNNGFFSLEELEVLLQSYNNEHHHGKKRIKLIAVSGASNVLGSCNDLKAIGDIARRFGARLMVDAAQLVAHRRIDMQSAGIDYLVFSAHKVYAPFGAGTLIARKGPLQLSSTEQELITASELENAGGIAALGKVLLLLNRIGFDVIEDQERRLTSKAVAEMSKIPRLDLYSVLQKKTTPNEKIGVIGFNIKNMMASGVSRKLARRSAIGIRWGCLCAHLIIKQLSGFTPFMERFQRFIVRMVPILNPQGIARASFGIYNTQAEVDIFISELKRIAGVEKAQGMKLVKDGIVKRQIKEFVNSREMLVYR